MDTLFEYTDYRKYLKDYYISQKARDSSFSHRYFLSQAGLKGPNFLKNVMDGKRNLSQASIGKFARVMKLSKREKKYFTFLVLFNQAKTTADKQKYFLLLSEFSRRSHVQTIQKNQFEYFSNWYTIAIREYIHAYKFLDNYDELVNTITPRVTIPQAKRSVKLLRKLGIITTGEDGYYKVTERNLTTGPEVNDISAYNYYKSMFDISREAMDTVPRESRYYRSIMGSFSEDAFHKIKIELDTMRKRIIDIIDNDTQEKKVYHIGMQLFPMSVKKGEKS
jgi:uncharacterized protein (TIGR02147 family)